jgi:hypothetical protein
MVTGVTGSISAEPEFVDWEIACHVAGGPADLNSARLKEFGRVRAEGFGKFAKHRGRRTALPTLDPTDVAHCQTGVSS